MVEPRIEIIRLQNKLGVLREELGDAVLVGDDVSDIESALSETEKALARMRAGQDAEARATEAARLERIRAARLWLIDQSAEKAAAVEDVVARCHDWRRRAHKLISAIDELKMDLEMIRTDGYQTLRGHFTNQVMIDACTQNFVDGAHDELRRQVALTWCDADFATSEHSAELQPVDRLLTTFGTPALPWSGVRRMADGARVRRDQVEDAIAAHDKM